MNKQDIWTIAQDGMNALGPHYQTEMGQAIRDHGIPNWFMLYVAQGAAPEPFTDHRWSEMFPYANLTRRQETLQQMADRGFFETIGEGTYRVTDKGVEAIRHVFDVGQEYIDKVAVPTLDDDELERYAGYLKRIVKATLAADVPMTYGIAYSRWTDPGKDAPAISRIDQYCTDLGRFRDDAHISAWMHHDIAGYIWETFTFIWQGDFEAVAERLETRGYDADARAAALEDLVARGWVVESDGTFSITDTGQQVRDEAESETDRYFYIGWDALSEDELADMNDLATRFRDGVLFETAKLVNGMRGEAGGVLGRMLRHPRLQRLEELGYDFQQFGPLYLATVAEPEPLSVDFTSDRSPYTAPVRFAEVVKPAVEAGGLVADNGSYRLTDAGRAVRTQVFDALYDVMDAAEALDDTQMDTLLGLLQRLRDHIMGNEDLPRTTTMKNGHKIDPGDSRSKLVQVDQIFDEIHFYRDDAHIAAFQKLGFSGPDIEALTFVWRDQASTPEALSERLTQFRGHDVDAYRAALDSMVAKGWLTESGGEYSITDEGRAVREKVEKKTDKIFYKPWLIFNAGEMNQLYRLLVALRDALRAYHESNAAEAAAGIYEKLNDAVGNLYPLYREHTAPIGQQYSFDKPGVMFTLFMAQQVDPVSPDDFLGRFPYGNADVSAERLETATELGYFVKENGGYQRTQKGKEAYDAVHVVFYEQLNNIGDKLEVDLERLEELLKRVVESSCNAPEPPGHLWINRMFREPPENHKALSRIDNLYDCLNAFRDETHIAAWKPLRVSGPAWEVLTGVWRSGAVTPAEVAEKMQFRGISAEQYAEEMAGLVERGWLTEDDGKFSITDDGKEVRENTENLTNRYFYGPWDVLNSAETEELRTLVNEFHDQLVAMREAKEKETETA